MKIGWIGITLALLASGCYGADSDEPYYMVFLRRAADRKPLTKEEGERIQAAHMANIEAMAARGVLVAAGPFEDQPPSISGLFVFKTTSAEEAKRIAEQDPTVVEHRNVVEVFEWRGPKGVGEEYRRLHAADPKAPVGMGVHPFVLLLRGEGWDKSEGERSRLLREHHEYVVRLRSDGKAAARGPVRGNEQIVGLVIYDRIPDDEARRLVNDDPAVKAGVLRPEFHRWWSAAHILPK